MQICPAHAERIPDVLIRTSSVSVKRDGKALNSDACHFHAFLSIDALGCRFRVLGFRSQISSYPPINPKRGERRPGIPQGVNFHTMPRVCQDRREKTRAKSGPCVNISEGLPSATRGSRWTE